MTIMMQRSRVAVLTVVLAIACGESVAQDSDPGRFLRWAYQDAAGLMAAARSDDAARLLGGVVLVGGVSTFDSRIDRTRDTGFRRSGLSRSLGLIQKAGGPESKLPVAGLFAISLLTDDTRFQDAAFTSLQSVIYAGAISYGIKFAVGRIRPESTAEPYEFRMLSGHSSFPSGHATTAFAALVPWALYYPSAFTYALVGVIGAGTAISRVVHDRHWASDVTAGSLTGAVIATILSRRHQRLQQGVPGVSNGVHVSVVPAVSYDAASLSLRIRF